jgi:hypothetical protein
MIPTVSPTFQVLPLLIDIFYGVAGLIVILIFHGVSINFVLMRFDRFTTSNLTKRQLDYEWVVEGNLSIKKAKSK